MRRHLLLTLLFSSACAHTAPTPPTSAADQGKRIVAEHVVVTSAHPLASEAGVEMLRQGGNAVDAAVATAFAVSVGEPQMSGLGGGGGILIWLQAERRAEYLDFYSAQLPRSFRDLETDSTAALREVAIPGQVAGLLEVHERFGRLPRAQVMAPAIRMAEEGVLVNQVLAQMIRADSAKLWRDPDARSAFWPDGRALAPGELLRQADLAVSLRRVAEMGREGFYTGETAGALVAELNAGGHPASLADLAGFRPRWKRPVCGEYRGRAVLSAPPPQTGMQIVHTLELLEPYDLSALGLPTRSAHAFHVLTSALRVGIADGRHIDDPNWADVPARAVGSEAYARARGALVGAERAPDEVEAGDPSPFAGAAPSQGCDPLDPYVPPVSPRTSALVALPQPRDDDGETTHISVVDAAGNAVALTQTNSSLFGSGARVGGFFLNDSGIDFSRSDAPVEGGRDPWRTRKSTISPTILLRDGRVEVVAGAPGGGRIPTAIVQSLVYTLDYGLDPLEAVRMPRIFPSPGSRRVQLENGFDAALLSEVRSVGYEPAALSAGYARLYMIVRRGGLWIGVADPRHDGEPRGY